MTKDFWCKIWRKWSLDYDSEVKEKWETNWFLIESFCPPLVLRLPLIDCIHDVNERWSESNNGKSWVKKEGLKVEDIKRVETEMTADSGDEKEISSMKISKIKRKFKVKWYFVSLFAVSLSGDVNQWKQRIKMKLSCLWKRVGLSINFCCLQNPKGNSIEFSETTKMKEWPQRWRRKLFRDSIETCRHERCFKRK